jgi:diguanylate cyclase (GGDEF)-like protein
MIQAPPPSNEASRLASLRRLNVVDTPAEERFNRIVRLATRSLRVPIALIALIDADRVWFKSAVGIAAPQVERAVSFCAYAILSDGAFVVTDATLDERFADNPFVKGPPHIRFYAGHPVRSPDGQRVGTVCVIDREPRVLSPADRETLEDLALLAEAELRSGALSDTERELRALLTETERRASIDATTRLWNRETILRVLRQELERSERKGLDLSVLIADIDHFKDINDTHGHVVGDRAIAEAAAAMGAAVRAYDSLGRYGGDEFIAVLPECGATEAMQVAERVRQKVRARPVACEAGELLVTVSLGVWTEKVRSAVDVEQVVREVDEALYHAKRSGRDCVRRRPPRPAMP